MLFTADREKRSIVPGQTPLIKTDATKKKRVFEPRYKRDIEHLRHKREAFDQEAYNRMDQIIKVSYTVF